MITRIRKWGNGLGLRLPKSILDQVNFQIDEDI
jgi:antitoxin component of MazEF toxin-antitoxin module